MWLTAQQFSPAKNMNFSTRITHTLYTLAIGSPVDGCVKSRIKQYSYLTFWKANDWLCLIVFDAVQVVRNCWKSFTKGVQFKFVSRIWFESTLKCRHYKETSAVFTSQEHEFLYQGYIYIIYAGFWLSCRWVCEITKSLLVNKAIFISDILKS